MNVIIVNDFAYVNGGTGKVAIDTAKLLAARGHSVIFFAAVGPVAEELQGIENMKVVCLNQHDILHDRNRLRAAIQGIWNIKAAKAMRKLLMNVSPKNTIVHIHALSKAISSSIMPVIKRKKVKVVYHVHDYGIVCPNMGFFDYQATEICQRHPLSEACLCCNCDARSYVHKYWRVIRQWVQNRCLHNIDGHIFVSYFSANILKKYVHNGVVIPNPLYIREKYKVDVSANNAVLFIGRLAKEKNVILLARAAKELNVPVIFIGSGACEKEILKANPDAILTGWLNKNEMRKYLSVARYLVFPSAWYETQGLVVPEVAAHGIPAIVSDTCAATDFVTDGENGLWFKNNDLDSLKLAMKKLSDDSLADEMGRKAYEEYREYREKCSDKYIYKVEEYYDCIFNH